MKKEKPRTKYVMHASVLICLATNYTEFVCVSEGERSEEECFEN